MKYLNIFLSIIIITLWFGILVTPDDNLHVIQCNVGQGDAMLITYHSSQILIDGGPDNKVLNCLSKYMPFYDKTIDMVVLTHPQTDHFTGLIDVFKNYKINYFLGNKVDGGSQSYKLLKNYIGSSGARVVNPTTGMKMRLGLIHFDVLSPSYNLANSGLVGVDIETEGKLGQFETKRDLNDFSIIGHLYFGDFDVLTTGDVEGNIEEELVSNGLIPQVDVLKVPHHGSKNGLIKSLLDTASPEVALISDGKNNRYGHPHRQTLDMLNEKGVKILRTDEVGDIEIVTDGKNWHVKE